METVSSRGPSAGHNGAELDNLAEVFGSIFTLEEIASAFMQANCNADLAGEILSQMLVAASSSGLLHPEEESDQPSDASKEFYEESSSPHPLLGETNFSEFQLKEGDATTGSIAGVMGKEYVSSKSPVKESNEESKSSKNKAEESKMSGNSIQNVPLSGAMKVDSAQEDIAEFLFKMLGDGFQLDRQTIYDVLGTCGYNMEKSMDTLLDLSASTLKKNDDVLNKASPTSMEMLDLSTSTLEKNDDVLNKASPTPSDGCYDPSSLPCHDKAQLPSSLRSKKNRKKNKSKLEKEVFQALFSVPERLEDLPVKLIPRREGRRSLAHGKVVTEPLNDTEVDIEHKTFTANLISDDESEQENSFKIHRDAFKEHWASMKEYYKAAAEAFAKGDHARADKLMEQGQFFSQKAREADEKSMQSIVEIMEPRGKEEEEVLLDLSIHKPLEAVKLFRIHLSNICAIPGIPYLKVQLGGGEKDRKEKSRKRLIFEFLDKVSVKWRETEEDPHTIVIRVDEINPNSFSRSDSVSSLE